MTGQHSIKKEGTKLRHISAFSNALTLDMKGLVEDAEKNERMIGVLELMINRIDAVSNDSLKHYIDITQSYSDMETHVSDYETLKNTGRLYSINNIDMLQRIIDMYDKSYGEIADWKAEDKRAIFMQDEFFIENYANATCRELDNFTQCSY